MRLKSVSETTVFVSELVASSGAASPDVTVTVSVAPAGESSMLSVVVRSRFTTISFCSVVRKPCASIAIA